MKKGMTLLMFVLGCCLFAGAQSNTSSDSMKKDTMMKHSKTMTGCIAEKDGMYMMMNKAHPNGVQLMSSEDLKPHVGHKMSVSGMMEKMSGDSMKSEDKEGKEENEAKEGKTMNHNGMGMMSMKVSSMKMISDHCDMSKISK